MTKVPPVLFELHIIVEDTAPGGPDLLKECLLSTGISPYEIVESRLEDRQSTHLSIYFTDKAKGLKTKRLLRRATQAVGECKLVTIKPAQWQDRWKKDFKPFQITPRIRVIPAWYKKYPPRGDQVYVYIDTSVAFGTGLHATTQFMVAMIERCKGQFQSFLDIGTGTGILTVVALKCGAKKVSAIDLNRTIVAIARENLERNGLSSKGVRATSLEKFKSTAPYDFVAANLITQSLIDNGNKITSLVKPGKFLAVSGISEKNYRRFRDAYNQFSLQCLKIERSAGWCAVLFRKAI